ncbi:MAG: hypothetical protein ACOCRO_04325 [Halanaerobiales bacterium]
MRIKAVEQLVEKEQTSRATYYAFNYSGKVLLEEGSDNGDSSTYNSYIYAFADMAKVGE